MVDPTLLEALRTQLPLAGLSPEAISALAEIAARRALAGGDVLFREGDPAEFLFVVASGALLVKKRSEDGVEMEMREMVPGEIGGLTSMYVDKTRSATLLAEGPAEVITFPRAAFQAALAGHPALSRALLAHPSGPLERIRAMPCAPAISPNPPLVCRGAPPAISHSAADRSA